MKYCLLGLTLALHIALYCTQDSFIVRNNTTDAGYNEPEDSDESGEDYDKDEDASGKLDRRSSNVEEDRRRMAEALNKATHVPTEQEEIQKYTPSEFNNLRQTFISFSRLLAHATFFHHGAPTSNRVGSFTTILWDAYNRYHGERKLSIWEQIESKVGAKIQQAITIEHFDNLKTKFSDFPRLMRKGNDFDEDDLATIVNLKHEVFPNDEKASYSPQWAPSIICWMMHVVAGYMELRKNRDRVDCDPVNDHKCIGECGLANEMAIIRYEVIQAIQALYQKRYSTIRGIDYNIGSQNKASFRYQDKIDSKKLPADSGWSTGSFSRMRNVYNVRGFLNPLFNGVYKTAELIRKHYNSQVDAIKDLFVDCENAPRKIDRFYTKRYNPRFFGSTKSSKEAPCVLPCDTYGKKKDFCPNYLMLQPVVKREPYDSGRMYWPGSLTANWAYCDRTVLSNAIPAERTVSQWLVSRDVQPKIANGESKFKPPQPYKAGPKTDLKMSWHGNTGKWGPMIECGNGAYAISFSMQNDFDDNDDNSGINSIRLLCTDGKIIESQRGPFDDFGEWSPVCKLGYDAVEHWMNWTYPKDKLGTVDLRLRCAETNVLQMIDQAEKKKFLNEQEKAELVMCPSHQRICGVKTRVQGKHAFGIGDAIALNDVVFKCCTMSKEHYYI